MASKGIFPGVSSYSGRYGSRPPKRSRLTDYDTKARYFNYGMLPVISTPDIRHVNIIPRGFGQTQRMGDICQITSVQMIAHVSSKTSTNPNMCVGYFVWDYEPNGTLPGITDFLQTSSPLSQSNLDNQNRFVFMPIFNVVFPFNAGVGTSAMKVPQDVWVMPPDAYTRYTRSDTTGDLANIVEGALYLVLIGEDPAGATQGEFLSNLRVNFFDGTDR